MITLITGGMRSGKSAYAESIFKQYDDVVYIATAEVADIEMANRVKKHIDRRNPKWRTYEGYRNLENAIGCEKFYLLDCVTNLVSRVLFDVTGSKEKISPDDELAVINSSIAELQRLIEAVRQKNYSLVIVTNEVGSSLVPMNQISRCFADAQGIVNKKIAELSDRVFLTVCGLPIQIKDVLINSY